MAKNQKIWIVVLVLIIIVFIGWRLYVNLVPSGTIKIGAVLSLTGQASTWSEYAQKAADLAVKDINDSGGVNGKKLEIIYEDGQTQPAVAVSAFQKLISADNVSVAIGDVWSVLTNPLIPIADTSKVVLISPTVMDQSVEGSSTYFYTLGHTVDSQKSAIEQFLAMNSTTKTAAIVCWNDAWGQAHTDLFKEILQEKGIRLVAQECTSDYSDDYRTSLAKIKAMHPDVMLVTTSNPLAFFKARYELGITVPMVTTNVVVDAIEDQHMSRNYALGTYFTNWLPDQQFIQEFEAAYGMYPIMEDQTSYEAIRSIAKALAIDPGNLLEGLQQVKYQGVDGPIDFTSGNHLEIDNAVAKLYRVDTSTYTEL